MDKPHFGSAAAAGRGASNRGPRVHGDRSRKGSAEDQSKSRKRRRESRRGVNSEEILKALAEQRERERRCREQGVQQDGEDGQVAKEITGFWYCHRRKRYFDIDGDEKPPQEQLGQLSFQERLERGQPTKRKRSLEPQPNLVSLLLERELGFIPRNKLNEEHLDLYWRLCFGKIRKNSTWLVSQKLLHRSSGFKLYRAGCATNRSWVAEIEENGMGFLYDIETRAESLCTAFRAELFAFSKRMTWTEQPTSHVSQQSNRTWVRCTSAWLRDGNTLELGNVSPYEPSFSIASRTLVRTRKPVRCLDFGESPSNLCVSLGVEKGDVGMQIVWSPHGTGHVTRSFRFPSDCFCQAFCGPEDNVVLFGLRSGKLLTMDRRNPRKIASSDHLFDSSISWLRPLHRTNDLQLLVGTYVWNLENIHPISLLDRRMLGRPQTLKRYENVELGRRNHVGEHEPFVSCGEKVFGIARKRKIQLWNTGESPRAFCTEIEARDLHTLTPRFALDTSAMDVREASLYISSPCSDCESWRSSSALNPVTPFFDSLPPPNRPCLDRDHVFDCNVVFRFADTRASSIFMRCHEPSPQSFQCHQHPRSS